MNAELEGYLDQLLSIVQDAPGIVAGLKEEQFYWSPGTRQWSIGDCFEHLNVTARQFVGPIDRAIGEARRNRWTSDGPYSYSLLERLFIRSMEPPPTLRVRTRPAFMPDAARGEGEPRAPAAPPRSKDTVMEEFYRWQDRLGGLLRAADGVDLVRTKLRSPMLPVFRYSLGACFAATLAHERRHLWQARRVRQRLENQDTDKIAKS